MRGAGAKAAVSHRSSESSQFSELPQCSAGVRNAHQADIRLSTQNLWVHVQLVYRCPEACRFPREPAIRASLISANRLHRPIWSYIATAYFSARVADEITPTLAILVEQTGAHHSQEDTPDRGLRQTRCRHKVGGSRSGRTSAADLK